MIDPAIPTVLQRAGIISDVEAERLAEEIKLENIDQFGVPPLPEPVEDQPQSVD
jgi:hypothetical protein